MDAKQLAKEALELRNDRIKQFYDKILSEVDQIQNMILRDYLNATPDAREKNQIFKEWNPMVLDLANGLAVLMQGVDAADKIIKG